MNLSPTTGLHLGQVILKVASRCNLNCSYCFVYNKADFSWRAKPALMSDDVFDATLLRIREQYTLTGNRNVSLAFHGGEPCLLGSKTFDAWCQRARTSLAPWANLQIAIQTNGTLLDANWIEVLAEHKVNIGISIDGPRDIHDQQRLDHAGRGSYDRVEQGIRLLRDSGLPYGLLCVIPLGADPLHVHRHFVEALRCKRITYLMPHFTHQDMQAIHSQYGGTPCASFLIPIFDEWWFNSTMDVEIGNLKDIARVIMGGASRSECIGNGPPFYVFIETNGDIEGLDNLKACEHGLSNIKLNVMRSGFADVFNQDSLAARAIFESLPLSPLCSACPEFSTCGGGHVAHRYSSENGICNPSVWCSDLKALFAHIRGRMGVTHDETRALRDRVGLKQPSAELL